MKKLLFLILMLLASNAFAQKDTIGLNLPYKNGTLVYQQVVTTTGQSANLLYSNAELWFAQHSRNGGRLDLQDTSVLRITGRLNDSISFKGPLGLSIVSPVRIMIQIDCKDGRYRCRVLDVILQLNDADNKHRYFIKADNMAEQLVNKNATTTYLNNNQAKRALASVNELVDHIMSSVKQTMTDKNDF